MTERGGAELGITEIGMTKNKTEEAKRTESRGSDFGITERRSSDVQSAKLPDKDVR